MMGTTISVFPKRRFCVPASKESLPTASLCFVVANYAPFAFVQTRKLIRFAALPHPTKSWISRDPHGYVMARSDSVLSFFVR